MYKISIQSFILFCHLKNRLLFFFFPFCINAKFIEEDTRSSFSHPPPSPKTDPTTEE